MERRLDTNKKVGPLKRKELGSKSSRDKNKRLGRDGRYVYVKSTRRGDGSDTPEGRTSRWGQENQGDYKMTKYHENVKLEYNSTRYTSEERGGSGPRATPEVETQKMS